MIIDVKEQVWPINVNIRGHELTLHWISIYYIYTGLQFQKILAKIRKKMCLSNKDYVSGHRCERTNMAAKCGIFMNCYKTFIGIIQKQM